MRKSDHLKRTIWGICVLFLSSPGFAQKEATQSPPLQLKYEAEIEDIRSQLSMGNLDLRKIGHTDDTGNMVMPTLELNSGFDIQTPAVVEQKWLRNDLGIDKAKEKGRTKTWLFSNVNLKTSVSTILADVYWVEDNFTLNIPSSPTWNYRNILLACYAASGKEPIMFIRYIDREAAFLRSQVKLVQTAVLKPGKDNLLENPAEGFSLYPNPAGNDIVFQIALTEPAKVTVQIFNTTGQLVDEPITAQEMEKGQHRYHYITNKLTAGYFLVKATIDNNTLTTSLIKR